MHRSSGRRGRRLFKTSATREGVARLIEEHTYTFRTVIGQQLKRKIRQMKERREHKEIEITKTNKRISSYTDSALVEAKIVVNIMAMKTGFSCMPSI